MADDLIERADHGSVRVLYLDNPPVNGLGAALRGGLAEAVAEAVAADTVEAIVIAGRGNVFCAGADIRELGKTPPDGTPTLPDVIDAIERSNKPVVAAIHGVAAGGGLELALGCHARIATADARVGLPEVTLGIIPGAGGTQRLPRLIGVEAALDLIVSGKLVPAPKAKALGVVDATVDDEKTLVETAVRYAAELDPKSLRRASEGEAEGSPAAFEDTARSIAKKARGFEAPYAAIEAVRASVTLPREAGFRKEREIFQRLVGSDQARAQRHVFFAEREAQRIPDVPKDAPSLEVATAGVVGCGTMGAGIAMSFANAGIPVVVVENDEAALERGIETIRNLYASSASKGRMSPDEVEARLERIRGSQSFDDLGDADIIVEAVFEDLEVKRAVFGKLDGVAKKKAVLATNTSSLDVDAIAAATSRPESVIGMHFFSPAHIMKLVENVRGERTAKSTIATVMNLTKRLGKVGVLVGICDGFVGNRMLYAYRRQADFLLEEGALPEQVDRALYEFGLPMGPFVMADLAGLDIGWAVRKRQAPGRPKHLRYSPIADRICEMGRFGQKTSAGWYRYEEGSRAPVPDPEVAALVEQVSSELGFGRRTITDEEIVARTVYALINEGAKILEEGIAIRSSDIDVVWTAGYGFPRYRGGPMFYADLVGVGKVYAAVKSFHEAQGEWMKPAPLLERLASDGAGFGGWPP